MQDSLIDRSCNAIEEPDLLCRYIRLVLVHHLQWGLPKSFLKVPLREELSIEEARQFLWDLPALGVEAQVTGSHEDWAEQFMVGGVALVVAICKREV